MSQGFKDQGVYISNRRVYKISSFFKYGKLLETEETMGQFLGGVNEYVS